MPKPKSAHTKITEIQFTQIYHAVYMQNSFPFLTLGEAGWRKPNVAAHCHIPVETPGAVSQGRVREDAVVG